MFQSFDETSEGDRGAERLALLRIAMTRAGLDGFIVPRADAFQGEYVAPCDARLAWLTGFTGSAGFCVALHEEAGIFVDGRYKVQVRDQIDATAYTPVDWPATQLGDWLKDRLVKGARVGFDPWLHTVSAIEDARKKLAGTGVELVESANLVDEIWHDRPRPPVGKATAHPIELAGEKSEDKRRRLARELVKAGQKAALITAPDSICWLLNIRGSDIPHVPIVQAFAILHADAKVDLFADAAKFEELGPDPDIRLHPFDAFADIIAALDGPVRVDRGSAPCAAFSTLERAGVGVSAGDDPCVLPKACKNEAELRGAREAHLTDAVAMVKFLHWLDETAPQGGLTEIDIARKLEGFRRETNALLDISFETISGSGPNAALPHYRVSTESNRVLVPGELMLVDSGGQYRNGTTDITRTMATGAVAEEAKEAYTRVLQGMIAVSRVRFPRGLSGRDLDALARYPLWLAGQDYDHGTGHGVGSYLSVHEGPQRISRLSEARLQPGMILSNEPGYYREGAFGIRIENLVVVQEAAESGDGRDQLDFETLTFVPIDTRPVKPDMLSTGEREWLNSYHRSVWEKVGPLVSGKVRDWLRQATAPL